MAAISKRAILLGLAVLSIPASAACAWICGTIHGNDPFQAWFGAASFGFVGLAFALAGISFHEGAD